MGGLLMNISLKNNKTLNFDNDYYNNSFDLFRLIAAIAVIFLHGFGYFNNGEFTRPLFLQPFSYINGVNILFAISAFCVCGSFDRSKDTARYYKKRISRIIPSLWIVLLLNTIIIFSLYYLPNIKEMFVYFASQFSFLRFYTADWLRGYGVGVPNPSLWTIFVEVQLYIIIALFYNIIKKWSLKSWIIILIGSILITYIPYYLSPYIPEIIAKLYGQTFVPYLPIFITGMMVYNFRQKLIPIFLKCYWIILIIYVLFKILYFGFDIRFFGNCAHSINAIKYHATLSDVLVVIFVISTAYKFGTIKFKFDISFPIYLFHMVIFNIFVHFNLDSSVYMLYLAILVTIFISFIYGRFIEKRLVKFIDKKVLKV